LTTYLFVDEDDNIIEEKEFSSETAAEKHGLHLMNAHNKVIGVYKEVVILDPIFMAGL